MCFDIVFFHFLSDWIFQPRAIAKRKTTSFKWMAKHLIVIHLFFGVLAYTTGISQWLVVLNTITHGIIDKGVWWTYGKFRTIDDKFLKYNKYAEDYWYYFAIAMDQIVHLYIIFLIFNQ